MKCILLSLFFFSCKGQTNHPVIPVESEVKFIEQPYIIDDECSFNNDQFRKCEMEKKRLPYASPSQKSLGQRFMIIDTRFFPKTHMIRHQTKMLGVYRHDDNGNYQKQHPMVKYPKILDELQSDLEVKNDQFFHENRIEFEALMRQVSIYSHDAPDFPYHHGETLFDFITEKNPDSQVVLVNYPRPSFHILCDASNNFELMRIYLNNSVKSLSRIIQNLDIDFSTLAITKNRDWAESVLNVSCEAQRYTKKQVDQFLKVYSDFHDNLFKANPETLFFQATDNNTYMTVNKKNYPTACSEAENVIRVSYVNSLSKVYSESGEEAQKEDLNPDGPLRMKKCADIFINGRADEETFNPWLIKQGYTGMDVLTNFYEIENLRKKHRKNAWYDETTFYFLRGLEKRPEFLMSSSWGTAVAASLANYLVHDEGIYPENLKNYFEGKIFDPLFHKQFRGNND